MIAFCISLLLLAVGCASSQNKKEVERSDYPNLVNLSEPESNRYSDSRVYVDSVQLARLEEQPVLVIHGDFPDGCTHLRDVSHIVENNQLLLALKTWRDPDQMCTQALKPFTYIYEELSIEKLEEIDSLSINEQTFPIQ